MEFAPELAVLSVTRGGAEARWTLSELLPARLHPHVAGAPMTAPARRRTGVFVCA